MTLPRDVLLVRILELEDEVRRLEAQAKNSQALLTAHVSISAAQRARIEELETELREATKES